uniref:eRF1 domain-containing protein n=1 Tax=Quercus lobata TaxID=97700 RepID=A0A7N2LP74_QUELO
MGGAKDDCFSSFCIREFFGVTLFFGLEYGAGLFDVVDLEGIDREASVAELMKFTNGVLFWDVSFFRGIHVRELEAMSSFIDTIYGSLARVFGEDKKSICKCNDESVDHLFIHCPVAMDLWSMVLGLFGDPSRACYGPKHVEVAHERLAIQTLLLTDELFRLAL